MRHVFLLLAVLGGVVPPAIAESNTLTRADEAKLLGSQMQLNATEQQFGEWMQKNRDALRQNSENFFCTMLLRETISGASAEMSYVSNEIHLAVAMTDKTDEAVINKDLTTQIPFAAIQIVDHQSFFHTQLKFCLPNDFISERGREFDAETTNFVSALKAIQSELVPKP